MKIAIIGYGKMGKAIEKIAKNRNHKITFVSNKSPLSISIQETDVALEFTKPESAFENIKICLENNIPIVCGTTGWLDKFNLIKDLCKKNNGSFLYSSNFSIGMNIFFEVNQKLSKILFPYAKDYEVKIKELHHVKKLDKPSGTSISLAKDIINNKVKKTWILKEENKKKKNLKDKILIISKRFGDIPGIHTVTYTSKTEDIKIQHKAHSREGFALGAIISAEWIKNKKGFFSMKEVLGLNTF
ncbi:4-hydroxy-tetrahydrodipicolinate reductase [Blattabacterium cuenoti]|uniref:4-hydroxy-tetrahydrodipicolinate reductase n=1 Tax=Blattabacterium cuenoti TaxID=1653831 RepID=UPI00163BBB56|nr:4-hydroxy-tetrahydrodipicolinate reductase [Blattabacterium cuenoti]